MIRIGETMRTSIRFGFLAVVVFAALYITRANACPHCNIHNYLAASIRSSTNIFHGKVIRQIDGQTAEVEVLKVLRGEHKVGFKVKSEMYGSKEYIGKKFIFSDPKSLPPTFEVLPLEFEDEILFLMQEEPVVGNLKNAVKRVQGVSVVTQGIGMEYLTNRYDEAVGLLIAELNTLMPEVFSPNDVFFGEHRLGKLIEALLYRQSDQASTFVFAHVDELVKQDPGKIDWAAIPYNASSRGVFLRDILRFSQKHEDLVASLRKRLTAALPKLSGITLADSTYAILISGLDNVDGVQKVLQGNESVDMVALGLYFAGNSESRWWQHDKAYAFWEKALSVAKRKELKDAISKRITYSARFWKHKTKDSNKAMDSDKK
jgi:hypothetical protein